VLKVNSYTHIWRNAQGLIFDGIDIVVVIQGVVGVDDIFLVEKVPDRGAHDSGSLGT